MPNPRQDLECRPYFMCDGRETRPESFDFLPQHQQGATPATVQETLAMSVGLSSLRLFISVFKISSFSRLQAPRSTYLQKPVIMQVQRASCQQGILAVGCPCSHLISYQGFPSGAQLKSSIETRQAQVAPALCRMEGACWGGRLEPWSSLLSQPDHRGVGLWFAF